MNAELVGKLQHYLANSPIDKAWIFGSYARNEETPDSDVDILVHFSNQPITLFHYIRILNDLKELVGKRVDMVEEGQLKGFAIDSFEKEKILIYERKTA